MPTIDESRPAEISWQSEASAATATATKTSAGTAKLSAVTGDIPRSVQITGPKNLTDLGKGQYGKWVGCSYSIQWGDGSGSPAGPIGASCAQGLSHTYKSAGTYQIVAKTFHPMPNDRLVYDWIGEVLFVVK